MKKTRLLPAFAAALLALVLLVGLTTTAFAADDESGATLTFSNSGIAETVAGEGYTISGTTLTIEASGVYTVTGSCAEGNIVVKKGTTGVVLILKDLDLACSSTAPLACNKTTETTLSIEGSVTLTDEENPANETSTDTAVADAFEGAAIKAKSGAKLTIEGPGTLTAVGTACKNGIKGGASSTVTVNMDGKLVIKAANNGLAADGEVVIKKGTLDITAGNEGIKAEPDEGDTESKGEITVSGGSITISAQSDGMQAAKLITIKGGTFHINAQRDGIQSNGDLTISDGSFTIKTFGGYNASGFNEDTMSCKGLKASSSDEDVENATNKITITGGTFSLNTRDDAVHSDGYIYITGGTFDIYTGDDGMHADSELHLGSADGAERDPDVRVNASYEGLEAGNLYIYGGRYYVVASDDGINAAGGSGSDHFNPWGPGGPGGGGPGGPGQNTGDYSINISGGSVYVNCNGDGLDSNGKLNLTGGVIEVWSMSSGDNSPLDSDGTLTVKGATVFAAGAKGVDGYPSPQGGQTYKNYTSGLSISSGKVVSIKNGSNVVFNTSAPKSAQFVFYSSPSFSTSWTCAAANGSVSCAKGNSWSHTWDTGVVTTEPATDEMGVVTYTCTVCGTTETQTIPALLPEEVDPEPEPQPDPDEGFAVTFVTDAGSSLQVYATQDVTGSPLLNIGQNSSDTDVSRNSDTGEPDSTGDGQVNFVVLVAEGYELDAVTATEGTYKNIKLISNEGSTYVYRVTKITAETTISVATKATGGEEPPEPQPDDGYSVTFTAPEHAEIWVYNTQTLSGDADVVIAAGESGTVLARDTQGKPDTSGNGQVNFLVVPAEGYVVDEVSATGSYKNLKGPDETGTPNGWRVTKIAAGDVAVTVTVKETGNEDPGPEPIENPFDDVAEEDYFYDAVLWAVNQEPQITNGTDPGKFSPNAKCTRGQVVTFLWRAMGAPEPEALNSARRDGNLPSAGEQCSPLQDRNGETAVADGSPVQNPFTDVKDTDYFYKAVLWAVENGITTGTGNGKFSPNQSCTRGQVVTFLWRAEGCPELTVGDGALDVPFDDIKADDYYFKAVLWAVENNITQGTGEGKFSPNATCTRGQIVTFLYRDLAV